MANNRAVADFGLMSLETLAVIIRKVLQFASGQATFAFQGGEPTLCGIDFYESVIRLQKELNVNHVRINNCLQTNGILVNARWAQFLHDHKFLVGLSLDGPAELHDHYRVEFGGGGTHARIKQTFKLFNQYQVEYNILFVVTGLTARHPNELYHYFKKNNFGFLQFMPCLDPPASPRGEHSYSLNPESYTFFLKHFFDKWYVDFMGGRNISIRYFDNLVRIAANQPPEMCSLRGSCQCQFVFEADGSVYPCDFYVTDEWKLGNIAGHELLELSASPNCRRFIQSSLSPAADCQDCRWQFLCRGGCRRDRENPSAGLLERNFYCATFSEFLPYVYPRLLEVARYVHQINSPRSLARTKQ
jgi:uncharacterized protein